MKTLLFIVDMQNDFCSPGGSLYVPGAERDAERLGRLIDLKGETIDHVILTQDQHHVMDIAHPCFWRDKQGRHPRPFTTISWWEVVSGEWIPHGNKLEVAEYLRRLIENVEYRHVIWPEHCIKGGEGAATVPVLFDALARWARRGRYYQVVEKGLHPATEFFGAFRANVPVKDAPETFFNVRLKETMERYDTIWIAGEARSHCVANTLKQLYAYPEIIRKLVILEDCTSDIPGCEHLAVSIYQNIARLGARFMTSEELIRE